MNNNLNPIVDLIHQERLRIEESPGEQGFPDDEVSGAINSLKDEAFGIVAAYVGVCMKNAMFTLSTEYPSLTGLVFRSTHDHGSSSIMIIPEQPLPSDAEQKIIAIEQTILGFVRSFMDDDLIFEFFDGVRVDQSGVVRNLSTAARGPG